MTKIYYINKWPEMDENITQVFIKLNYGANISLFGKLEQKIQRYDISSNLNMYGNSVKNKMKHLIQEFKTKGG